VQRKEVRIALGIVGCLLVIFAVALVWRLGFSGSPKADEVAAAPDDKAAGDKDKKEKGKAEAPAGKEEHDAPTVLTATKNNSAPKNAAAQKLAAAEPAADNKNWQSDYQREPTEADPADYAAEPPAASDPWANYKGPAGEDFAKSDPYGYGGAEEPAEDAAEPEPTATPDQFAQHDLAAAGHEAEPQPTGKSRGNPIRQQPQAGASRNPFREAAPTAAEHSRDDAAMTAAAQEPRPNLQDDPAAEMAAEAPPRGAAGRTNPLQNGWAITPADHRAPAAEADPVEAIDAAEQAGVHEEPAVATAAAQASAQPRNTPRLLTGDAAGSSAQSATHRAAPADAVVPTSAETEATEAPPGFYKVAAGDTYWRISRAIYGDPGYYRALYEHNRQRFPRADKLPAGTELATPALATLEQMHPEFCPSKSGQ